MNNLVVLYHKLENYEKAHALFESARELRENIFAKNHPSYAESLNNLEALYYEQRNYEKALELYE